MDTSGYPDSVDSSPRSRGGESWDEPFPSSAAAAAAPRLRLMCSYGGRIVPRPTDKSLCYLGGETRIVVVDRHASLADLHAKLSRSLLNSCPFSLKYQLPNEDLDSLISVSTDEDHDNMIDEYDRIVSSTSSGSGGGSTRTSRLRLFLFPSKPESTTSSVGSLLDDSSKSETWFVDALNSAMGDLDGFPRADSTSVNCLLGLEDDSSTHSRGGRPSDVRASAAADQLPRPDSTGKLTRQDVHSVPDSPMLDTSSSFGSASSAPSLSNLPPIRVRADDRPPDSRISDLNDQFAHMGISVPAQRQDEGLKEAALHYQQPPVPPPAASASNPIISPAENPNRVFSDDEKSDHGGVRRMPQPSSQQQKPSGFDLPIPDPNARSTYYQERTSSAELKPSDAGGYRAPFPVADAGQIQQQQQIHYHQQPLPPPLQPQAPPQQQFIQANPHYIHHPATGTFIPVPSYYSVPQQSQQSHSQVPMYYLPIHQNPPPQYNLAPVQPNLADPTAGKPTVPMMAVKQPELPPSSLYRTAAATPPPTMHPNSATPQLIHVSAADQAHQFAGMGYHLMHHQAPSQPQAAMANYAYEFADPATAPQMYYSQATSPPPAPQYQTMSAAAVAAIPDAQGEAKQTRG